MAAAARRRFGPRHVLALAACLVMPWVQAQVEAQPAREDANRPRIALVLSGGGALGLAHIGAIQEMEALGLRPDLVVGTSMGAIIGGLYASGVSPDSLGELVSDVDWAEIFNPEPERSKLSYRHKQQQADFPGTASLGVSLDGIVLPTGVIPDQYLLRELRQITPVRMEIADFDALPIPFRAIATDISTGEAVIIDRGELPTAMRASMSVPGVFPAVSIDNRLLVDGGLSANIPVQAARDLGAEIVIALWTPSALLQTEEIDTVVDVLGQTVSLLILANERAEIAGMQDQDILIEIDTGGISAAAFNLHQDLIEAGRQAIRQKASLIAALAAGRPPPTSINTYPDDQPVISFVRIENTSRLNQSMLEARLSALLGERARPERINDAIERVYALGPFERVDYSLATQDGLTGLVIRAEDAVPDAGRVRLGLLVESDFEAGADTALSFDYRSPILDAQGSELRTTATIGDVNELGLEYLRFLDNGQNWFSMARLQLQSRPYGLYDTDGFRLADYDLSHGLIGLDAGRQLGNFGEIRLGLEKGTGRLKLTEGLREVPDGSFDIGRIFASAGIDTRDDPFFPRQGLSASARWTAGTRQLGDRNYQSLSASALQAASTGRHTFLASLDGGWRLAGTPSPDMLFRLGGLFSLSGYRRDELAGENFLLGRVIYRRSLEAAEQPIFGIPLFTGGSIEAGEVWSRPERISAGDLQLGASVFIGASTALGPVYLAFGQSQDDRRSAYLLIGRSF